MHSTEDDMQCSEHHKKLTNGVGKCSVPMWMGGLPAGFCDEDAYGKYIPGDTFRHPNGDIIRFDGKYAGYVPHLACPGHGGPKRKDVAHRGDPCEFCGTPHADVEPGPCPHFAKEATA